MNIQNAVGYQQYAAIIQGTVPMLMHNGEMSNPANPIAKKLKEVSSKRKKTDADFKAMADLEFKGGLYLNQENQIFIPTLVLEANIVAGAKKTKEGQTALSSMFVDPGSDFRYDGPTDPEERLRDPSCRFEVGVRVQRNRVQRTRPIFHNWSLTFPISVFADTVNHDMLTRWLKAAGQFKGIGDWVPRYGRYELVALTIL